MTAMPYDTCLRGTGMYVPARILSNAELETMVETSEEWIETRTGIKTRRIAAPGQACSDLAVQAATAALTDAGIQATAISHIIVATTTPDGCCPGTASKVQHSLGIAGCMAFDLNAACSGFLYGLEVARGFIALYPEACVLLIGSEVMSSRVNWQDRSTCVLFGDGAGAVLVTRNSFDNTSSPDKCLRLIDIIARADGQYADLLTINGGGSCAPYKLGDQVKEDFFVQMKGPDVFKVAVRSMVAISEEILVRHGLRSEDIDLFIPHQANSRIIDAVRRKLHMPEEKVFINVNKYGNTSAASIAIALCEARESGRIQPGSKVLLTTLGGGFTWASALLSL